MANIYPVAGIQIGTTCAGIKQTELDDLALFQIDEGATCAAVFTRNAFCAAPVTVAKQHLNQTTPRYLLINSGNANAGTGEQGMQDALSSCEIVGQHANCAATEVLPFSTGVIGQTLPMEKIRAAIPHALQNVGETAEHWQRAAAAIMTTDTKPKLASKQIRIEGKTVTVTGISKGSGMIKPDMATMLAYVAIDANISQTVLQTCLTDATNQSFNRISVDSDTSTNDACVLVATGKADLACIDSTEHPHYAALAEAITEICIQLAQAIVKDGEGATKFISIEILQGANQQECLDVAYTIAHSPLVKTAFYASDANWGRILAAVGRAGLQDFDIEKIKIYLGSVCIVENGGVAASYTEEQGQAVMSESEITVRVELGRGQVQETVWTCDLSYDYVKINAEYRT
ncbi:bifunctional glutamate N-acetyltransferase/amino-acid acetyltransferase ArgJ [Candidatus Albibeggiatoa sp. nov. NOAA]|uniref:bifunctional glutamate N-acetyltransferase/amino-acid acetyltransferase ArgJ n=1 Tax=Candidatus Albibeggiatoa sp. nov. NOAA TaxID=3162724 RepID=UPI0032F60CDB|nr:bifunctional glutamate N-acetyltransferase/amino-acid acetyltransferase ArgJ [Thiotrichaceae bacterium]